MILCCQRKLDSRESDTLLTVISQDATNLMTFFDSAFVRFNLQSWKLKRLMGDKIKVRMVKLLQSNQITFLRFEKSDRLEV